MNTATEAQIKFAKKLVEERAGVADAEAIRTTMNQYYSDLVLTKAELSKFIDQLLRIEKPAKIEEAASPIDIGFYMADDGGTPAVYSVVEGKSGHPYAKRYNDRRGRYEYESGAIVKLRKAVRDGHAARLTLEDAMTMGKATGRCVICGAELTNPVSVEAGIGPICAGRL